MEEVVWRDGKFPSVVCKWPTFRKHCIISPPLTYIRQNLLHFAKKEKEKKKKLRSRAQSALEQWEQAHDALGFREIKGTNKVRI